VPLLKAGHSQAVLQHGLAFKFQQQIFRVDLAAWIHENICHSAVTRRVKNLLHFHRFQCHGYVAGLHCLF
jgi:hypothetical protein